MRASTKAMLWIGGLTASAAAAALLLRDDASGPRAVQVEDDHWLNPHEGLTAESAAALDAAIEGESDTVTLELDSGASDPGEGRIHRHRLMLNSSQLDALAAGETLEVSTLYTMPLDDDGKPFKEHSHTVRIAWG